MTDIVCTLSRTVVCLFASILIASCGGDDRTQPPDRAQPFKPSELKEAGESGTLTQSACRLLSGEEVARTAGWPDGRPASQANDSTNLSICDWRAGGRRIQIVVDAAPSAQLRFFNQLSEQLQFHNPDPEFRPRQLRHR